MTTADKTTVCGESHGHADWVNAVLPNGQLVAAEYWPDAEHWVFDPWGSRHGALNLHDHCHTKWARNIHFNWRSGRLENAATFDWKGKTIYIVGRGKSLKENVQALNRRPDGDIALFLNHAFKEPNIDFKSQDFVCAMDEAVRDTINKHDASGKQFITCPTMGPDVVEYPWREVYGFTLWPSAPLNDFMRELFPDFPQANETLGIAVSALHLAALNGAKRIVLVGQDCTSDEGEYSIELPLGTVRADQYYTQLAQAIGVMAYFIWKRTGAEIVNSSHDRLVGYNIIDPKSGYMPWVKFASLENIVSGHGG